VIPPRRIRSTPSEPEVFCGKEEAHTAHVWDEVAPEDRIVLWGDPIPQPTDTIHFERHWCRGNGHLKGSI
jgi:hypothetical protein